MAKNQIGRWIYGWMTYLRMFRQMRAKRHGIASKGRPKQSFIICHRGAICARWLVDGQHRGGAAPGHLRKLSLGIIATVAISMIGSAPTVTAPVRPHVSAAAQPTAPVAPAIPAPLAAPARRAPSADADPMAIVRTFKVEDLRDALAEAQASTDTVAATCYEALIPIVQAHLADQVTAGPGPFLALQKMRNATAMLVKMQSPDGPLSRINVACAPLVLDAQSTMAQLGAILGSNAGTTGSVTIRPQHPQRRKHMRKGEKT